MLRRCLPHYYVHRTLAGVTVTDAAAVAALDAHVDLHKLPHAPAAYWLTKDLAQRHFLPVQRRAVGCEVPLAATVAPTATVASRGGAADTTARLFHVNMTDAPATTPAHLTAGDTKLHKDSQTTFEAVAIARRLSSLKWFTTAQLQELRKAPRASAQPLVMRIRDAEHKYFNEDDVEAAAPAAKTSSSPSSSSKQRAGDASTASAPSEKSASAKKTTTADQSTRGHAKAALQRNGGGSPLPVFVAKRLTAVAKSRGYESDVWYTLKQLQEWTLRPKNADEAPVEVLAHSGSLSRLYNADAVVPGVFTQSERLKHERVLLATPEMEALAAESDSFLTANGTQIWQDARLCAVRDAFVQRGNPRASRQYLSLWEMTRLGLELAPQPGPAAQVPTTAGHRVLLYNRDDTTMGAPGQETPAPAETRVVGSSSNPSTGAASATAAAATAAATVKSASTDAATATSATKTASAAMANPDRKKAQVPIAAAGLPATKPSLPTPSTKQVPKTPAAPAASAKPTTAAPAVATKPAAQSVAGKKALPAAAVAKAAPCGNKSAQKPHKRAPFAALKAAVALANKRKASAKRVKRAVSGAAKRASPAASSSAKFRRISVHCKKSRK